MKSHQRGVVSVDVLTEMYVNDPEKLNRYQENQGIYIPYNIYGGNIYNKYLLNFYYCSHKINVD